MHQSKKGNPYYFGAKAHIGVDMLQGALEHGRREDLCDVVPGVEVVGPVVDSAAGDQARGSGGLQA